MSSYIQYRTFADRAAFRTWRAGIGESAAPAAYCVTIQEGNETFTFSVNISKPIRQAGIGDLVVWDTADACFKAFPQSALFGRRTSDNPTGLYCKLSEVFVSKLTGCTVIGTVYSREGHILKIADLSAAAGKPWYGTESAYDLKLNGDVHTSTALRNGMGGTYWTGAWDWELTNFNYASNATYVGYWIGVTKSAWDTAVAAWKAGTGDGKVTATSGQISGDFYVQDWGCDYDRFQRRNVLARFPGRATDANAAIDGLAQTRAIVKALLSQAGIALTDTSTAAGYCWNHSKAVDGFGAHCWHLPTIDELILIERAYAAIGSSYQWMWSCVQYAGTNAWRVNGPGDVYASNKYAGALAAPASALNIEHL